MEYTTLGKTGLRVSVAGLGCGGNSRIGLGTGRTEAESIALVHAALDLGINYFDTAETYGTEPILGRALAGRDRSRIVVSTKARVRRGSEVVPLEGVLASLEGSLRNLGTDCLDVFMLHGVPPAMLDGVRNEMVPVLLKEKEKGKIRHLGITEVASADPQHAMLDRALDDPVWEVIMFAFHLMNQNARQFVFPRTQSRGVGTLLMFVVRNIFSKPGVLAETMQTLAAEGRISADLANHPDPLGFLVHAAGAQSLLDAAYRFGRYEPGSDVVLFGTSSIAHMQSNVASILRPPLPAADLARLGDLFGHLTGVGLDAPEYLKNRRWL
jgi:aryl-alcohol dehydrogenase-like predicted oxidoreductase